MFVVDNILISDELVDAPFTCNLGACQGACCVHGDSGAPLDRNELEELEAVLPLVEHRLRPEARAVIQEKGVWEKSSRDQFCTTCVGNSECVFVTYRGPVARCAIEEAYEAGKTVFRKPISCQLFPIRVQPLGDFEGLNYEKFDMCRSGVRCGVRENVQLVEFLEEPLGRKFGQEWIDSFKVSSGERRSVFTETR